MNNNFLEFTLNTSRKTWSLRIASKHSDPARAVTALLQSNLRSHNGQLQSRNYNPTQFQLQIEQTLEIQRIKFLGKLERRRTWQGLSRSGARTREAPLNVGIAMAESSAVSFGEQAAVTRIEGLESERWLIIFRGIGWSHLLWKWQRSRIRKMDLLCYKLKLYTTLRGYMQNEIRRESF